MTLKILQEDDPMLRGVCLPVSTVTADLKKLALDMCETMTYAKGIGLSAPQVNHKIKLIVFDTTFAEDEGKIGIMFNPEILHGEGLVNSVEGCLSLPGRQVCVRRYKKIKVKYLTTDSKSNIVELEGLAAIVVQHEVDHLDGIILSDYEEQ